MSHIKNVLMVLAPSDCRQLTSSAITTPLGAIILASKARILGYEAKAFNGEQLGVAALVNLLDRQVTNETFLGLTCTAGNVDNTRWLIDRYAPRGATIAVGGPNITGLKGRILHNWDKVSLAFSGFAEVRLKSILEGKWKETPGVAYRRPDGSVCDIRGESETQLFDFQTPRIDYKVLHGLANHRGATILYSLACAYWKDRCFFCARMPGGYGSRNPEIVWDEIRDLHQRGINYFYHAADSVTVGSSEQCAGEFIRELVVKQSPELHGKITHRVFANAFEFYEPAASILAALGHCLVHVGFESAALLAKVGKGKTRYEDNVRVLELCKKHNLPLIISFVLGLPGENQATLQQTAEYIKNLVEQWGMVREGGIIAYVEASPLMVLPGSRAADQLWQRLELPQTGLLDPIQLDFAAAGRAYCQLFCDVSRDEILEKLADVASHCRGYIDVKGITNKDAVNVGISLSPDTLFITKVVEEQ